MVKHGGSPIGSLAFEKSQKLRGYIPTYMYIYIYIYLLHKPYICCKYPSNSNEFRMRGASFQTCNRQVKKKQKTGVFNETGGKVIIL